MKTLDAHQDKVWGLHGSRKDDKMVTGSADSNITVWVVSVIFDSHLLNRGCGERMKLSVCVALFSQTLLKYPVRMQQAHSCSLDVVECRSGK